MPFELFTDQVNDYRQCVPWLLPKILTRPSDIIKEPFTAGLESFQSAEMPAERRGLRRSIVKLELERHRSAPARCPGDRPPSHVETREPPRGSQRPRCPTARVGWALPCGTLPRALLPDPIRGHHRARELCLPGCPSPREVAVVHAPLCTRSLGGCVNAGGYTA